MKENKVKEYMDKMEVLEGIIEESDNPDYLVTTLHNLYKTLIGNGQFAGEKLDQPLITKRLVRCYRYIPNYVLDINNIERIVIGGLYLNIEVCMIPTELLSRNFKRNRKGYIFHPEEDGLPSTSVVNYGTLKYISDSVAVALVKGSGIDNWLELASQYDYITLS